MGVLWHKVWRDLTHNLPRTVLAVLSIAAGVFALGLALGGLSVMQAALAGDDLAINPAQLTFRTGSALQATSTKRWWKPPGSAPAWPKPKVRPSCPFGGSGKGRRLGAAVSW